MFKTREKVVDSWSKLKHNNSIGLVAVAGGAVTYPHCNLSNSLLSIFLNLESLNALIRAYSASPSCRGMGSKLPMQPRKRHSRPCLMCQVINKGLEVPFTSQTQKRVKTKEKRYYSSSENEGTIGFAFVRSQ